MATWKLVKSGGKTYTIQKNNEKEYIVRRDNAFTRTGGTRLGQVTSLADALDVIKSDSGSRTTDVRDL